MNPACLKQIGKYNTDQWSYQRNAWDILSGSEYDPISNMTQCTGNPSDDNFLDTCKLTSNGTKLIEFCDMGTNLYQNKCYDTFTVDPNDDHASSYPPIQYDPSYITMCCGLGLGDDKLCDTNPDVVKQLVNILPDESESGTKTNQAVYQYLKRRNLKLQK
jgi:hypothetical protein